MWARSMRRQPTMRRLPFVLLAVVLLAAVSPALGENKPRRETPLDDARPTTAPATAPATVVEALRPLVPKLPKPTSFRLNEVDVGRADAGLAFIGMPVLQQKKLEASVLGVAGFAGADAESTGEGIDLCVITFDDPALARQFPDWKAKAFRETLPFIAAAGVTVDKLVVERPKLPATDTRAVLVRLTGTVKETGKPFTNTHVRVAQGNQVVEVVLRNLTLPENELLELTAEAARRVRGLASPSTRPAPKVGVE